MTRKNVSVFFLLSAALTAGSEPLGVRREFVCPGNLHFTSEYYRPSAGYVTVIDWNKDRYELKRRVREGEIQYANDYAIFGEYRQKAFFTIGDVLHLGCLPLSRSTAQSR